MIHRKYLQNIKWKNISKIKISTAQRNNKIECNSLFLCGEFDSHREYNNKALYQMQPEFTAKVNGLLGFISSIDFDLTRTIL